MIILKLKDIEKSYKKRNKTISVLKEVNHDFKSNKLYTIPGRRGAGKPTLIMSNNMSLLKLKLLIFGLR